MAKSKGEILDDIERFIAKYGNNPRQWYLGTAKNAKNKLFQDHGFKNGDIGLIREAMSELQAGEIVEFFTGRGAKGGAEIKPGNDFVYAYKITSHTKQ